MKLTKQLEAEINLVYDKYWKALLMADIDAYTRVLDKHFKLIGTTETEVFFNRKEAIQFLKDTADQIVDNIELRNRHFKTALVGSLALITEQSDTYAKIDGAWRFYGKARISSLLEKKKEDWKFIQMHLSFPDSKAGEGQTIGLDKISKENLELKEAVKRRTIELENKSQELALEVSLERVRTVAMAMKKPEDMQDICHIISTELEKIGFTHIRNVQTAIIDVQKKSYLNYEYFRVAQKKIITQVAYEKNKDVHAFVKRMLKDKEASYLTHFKGAALKKYIDYQKKHEQFIDTDSKKANAIYWLFYSIGNGALGMSTYDQPISKANQQVFHRFRNVFQLAYQRFIDIQKAEAQAREAQIEAALERVRSTSLSMHSSHDLSKVVYLVFTELVKLDAQLDRCLILTVNPDTSGITWYLTGKEGLLSNNGFLVENNPHPSHQAYLDGWKTKRKKWHYLLAGEEKRNCDAYLFSATELVKLPDFIKADMAAVESIHLAISSDDFGCLIASSIAPLSEAHAGIVDRFTSVFNQAYTRFLDLQKAEAQTREAEIELALERVRARTMAMQHSDELADASFLLDSQVRALGIKTRGCAFNIYGDNESTEWFSSEMGTMPVYKTPRANIFLTYYEEGQKGKQMYIHTFEGDACAAHYDYLCTLPIAGDALKKFKESGGAFPARQIDHVTYFKFGYLLFITLEPVPEAQDIFKRFAKVFEQTYTRFLDLQKAEAQAKEAQIESALERVRSRSLAMHHSSELSAVVDTLLREFTNLEFTLTFCIINLINEYDRSNTVWAANPETGKLPESYYMKFEDYPFHHAMWNAWKNQEKRFIYTLEGEEKKSYDEYLYSSTEFSRFPLHVQEANKAMKRYVAGFTFFKYSGLQTVSENNISEDELNMLERFGKVFEQSYTRFLDLQKAEAQAKEAQIELALERVRARTMAMQKSSELKDIAHELRVQLAIIGTDELETCAINLYEESDEYLEAWAAVRPPDSSRDIVEFHFNLSKKGIYIIEDILNAYASGVGEFVFELSGEKGIQWMHIMEAQIPDMFDAAAASASFKITGEVQAWFTCSFFSGGALIMITMTPPLDASRSLLKRCTQVFGLAYRRFADLKKAEAQTKEAQIEAALEKVRSRTMAMQSSDELQETAALLFQEFKKLGTDNIYQVTIGIYNEEEESIDFRVTSWAGSGVQENRSFHLNMNEPTVLQPSVLAWKAKKKSLVIDLSGEVLEEWLHYRNKMSGITVSSTDTAGRRVISCAYYSKGHLSISTPVPVPPETLRTLERFAAVFDTTYTRFLDLQKAEAQAREAQIEAALEKVRSRTLAMQKSEELAETASVLFQQLISLGIEPNRLYITIIHAETDSADFWITNEDGSKLTDAYSANLEDNSTFKKMYEGWKKQWKHLVIDMQGEELQNYFYYLQSKNVPFKGGLEQKRRVQHLAYFSKGFIGMASPDEQPAVSLQLLERFAEVFNLTFTRFNDLKIAEAHAIQAELDLIAIKEAKQKAEHALTELQATQKQLIQSEKMASLGELTAGIAHEIQNPLNFVNNFSEVSKELLDEMKEAIANGNTAEAKQIMDDVIQNLEKINHHGKRADGIVKGMLQHSSTGYAQKEPTDINKLADEYLRLAYHGLRAKDKSFNAIMKTHFDETIGNINIIPQDMGRVILNLITNAFYAVNEKSKQGIVGYEPTVEVITKKEGNKVLVSVKDTGNGIPPKILDKIFQPFFTTKPTGQGTGLGLSLSYDIVKAHGGVLKMETIEGEGSTFIIQLLNDRLQ